MYNNTAIRKKMLRSRLQGELKFIKKLLFMIYSHDIK